MTKREQILATTLKLVAKQSIQATPMSQIVEESKVATGTIYYHFKSKDEIIREIYLNKKRDLQKLIQNNLDENEPLKSQFFNMWNAMYDYYISNPLIFWFVQQASNSSTIDQQTKTEGEKYYVDIVRFFAKGINSQKFIDMHPALMGELVHGNICTLVELQLKNQIEDIERQRKSAVTFSWNAINKK